MNLKGCELPILLFSEFNQSHFCTALTLLFKIHINKRHNYEYILRSIHEYFIKDKNEF